MGVTPIEALKPPVSPHLRHHVAKNKGAGVRIYIYIYKPLLYTYRNATAGMGAAICWVPKTSRRVDASR